MLINLFHIVQAKKNHKIDPWPQFYCLQILIFLEFNKNVKRKTIDFYFVLTFSSNLDLSSVKKLKIFLEVHIPQVGFTANLCEYFVTIHGQHKIRGIRDASSSGCCRSSLIFVD